MRSVTVDKNRPAIHPFTDIPVSNDENPPPMPELSDPPDRPVLRFAPSPNGHLHLGHAYSALFAHHRAKELDGRFLLRIEDIDVARCTQEFTGQVLEDLAWLGLEWEQPVRRQSDHFGDYTRAVERLDGMGVLYPCFATRQEIRRAVEDIADHPVDPDGAPLYPGLSKGLAPSECETLVEQGKPYALRLDMDKAVAMARDKHAGDITFEEHGSGPDGETGVLTLDPEVWGDVVIARKDINTSYHLSVVFDDALQGVTHVTRGQDLFHATPVHRLLQVLLDLPEPTYEHHGLVRDDAGRRLSKSARDRSLLNLRATGHTPDDIRQLIGFEQA